MRLRGLDSSPLILFFDLDASSAGASLWNCVHPIRQYSRKLYFCQQHATRRKLAQLRIPIPHLLAHLGSLRVARL